MHAGDLRELQEAGLSQPEKDALLDVMKRARVRRERESSLTSFPKEHYQL